MKRDLLLVVAAMIVTAVLVRECAPRVVTKPSVPQIVTVYDTVEALPEWFDDSLKAWAKRLHTTDTVNLVLERIVVRSETAFVSIPCDTAQRSRLQPVVSYFGGSRFGDTALVTSISLRSGNPTISKVFIPGILTAMVADSVTGTPSMTFAPFPEQKKNLNFWEKVKYTTFGSAGMSLVCLLKP